MKQLVVAVVSAFLALLNRPLALSVEECGTECTAYKRIVCAVAATNCSDTNNDTQRNECIRNIVSFRSSFCLSVSLASDPTAGWGGKKHEIYVAAFGGHPFYDLFVQGWGAMAPSAPHGSATALPVSFY